MTTHRILGGILLIAGTTIGGAVLALPVATGQAGFFLAATCFILCWLYLTFTAFLFLEVNLYHEKPTNLISMAESTLGPFGRVLGWTAYLFLLYSLTTAFLAGSSSFIQDLSEASFGYQLPDWLATLPLLLLFFVVLNQGTHTVDMFNRLLMIGLGLSFFALVLFIAFSGSITRLANVNPSHIPISVSIIATAFGYHIIIPTLTEYLKRDIVSLKRVILIGSAIPLVLYLVWELFTLAAMPLEGTWGLIDAGEKGIPVTRALSKLLEKPSIVAAARIFEITAMLTTFTGVALSLLDCLSDALGIKKDAKGMTLLSVMTLLPPYLLSLLCANVFFAALGLAGGYGVTILLGLLPALMVWSGRYHQNRQGPYRAPGGRKALVATIITSLLIIGNETWLKIF